MGKYKKKKISIILMMLGIMLLVGGILLSISLGAKNIDIQTIIGSIFSDY